MHRSLLSVVALLVAGLAIADTPSLGRYLLRTPEDAARVARLSGKSAPESGLTLHANGRFLLETNGTVRHGDYRVREDRLTLRVEDGSELRGEVRDDAITLEGLQFDHVRALASDQRARNSRRFPTDGASGRLRRNDPLAREEVRLDPPVLAAPPVEAPKVVAAVPDLTTVFKELPIAEHVNYKAPIPAPVLKKLEAKEIAGTWTVWRNGHEEKGQRMTLNADGTFRFKMVNASSEGTWTVEDRHIVLVWTKIDGEDVEEPGTVKKEIPVSDDGGAFQVDTYRYERATTP